jgi:hypothetical protein
MFRPPLIRAPPQAPLPDPTSFPQWYGDFWIQYPLDPAPIPAHHGADFKARAELTCIINEMAIEYFAGPQSPDGRSITSILKLLSKLEAWRDALPGPLTAKHIVLPSQLKLQ